MFGYDGPLDFYWHEYSNELMLFLIVVGVVLRSIYKRTGQDGYKSLANISIASGFGVFFLSIVTEGIMHFDLWYIILSFVAIGGYLLWRNA